MGILPDPISPDSYHILADSDMTNICCLFVFLVFYYSTMVNQYCSPPFGEYVYSNHLKQVQANKNDTHNYIYTWLTLICISKFTLVTFKHQSLHVFKLKTNIIYVYMLTNVYIYIYDESYHLPPMNFPPNFHHQNLPLELSSPSWRPETSFSGGPWEFDSSNAVSHFTQRLGCLIQVGECLQARVKVGLLIYHHYLFRDLRLTFIILVGCFEGSDLLLTDEVWILFIVGQL